ncbi:MAG: helix-turn-helix domain-containing protein [Synergistaceae bacterium]|jgi:DNA-binding MarR family transcriptional regulator|nr:helix-turn-helix domain-containing protein [Synergistaceae bacterium]
MNKLFAPDFLIIPYELLNRQNLSPADWLVFSAVYWFEKLKDGRCTAANETIGKIVQLNERTVRRSLEKLEKEGFVKRIFIDGNNKKRSSIKVLLFFKGARVGRHNPTVGLSDPTQIGLNDPQNKNINKKDLIRKDFSFQKETSVYAKTLANKFSMKNNL